MVPSSCMSSAWRDLWRAFGCAIFVLKPLRFARRQAIVDSEMQSELDRREFSRIFCISDFLLWKKFFTILSICASSLGFLIGYLLSSRKILNNSSISSIWADTFSDSSNTCPYEEIAVSIVIKIPPFLLLWVVRLRQSSSVILLWGLLNALLGG